MIFAAVASCQFSTRAGASNKVSGQAIPSSNSPNTTKEAGSPPPHAIQFVKKISLCSFINICRLSIPQPVSKFSALFYKPITMSIVDII